MFIEHINIRAPLPLLTDEKVFFCELFDLTPGFRPEFQRAGYWLYHGDKALVHLTACDIPRNNQVPGFLDHVAFRLEGLPEFIARLEQMSVAYHREEIPELQLTQLFFKSPTGIRLEASFLTAA